MKGRYVFGYRVPGGRSSNWIFTVVFGGATLWMVGAAAVGQGPPLLALSAWVAALIWIGYWLLWAGGDQIEVADGRVRWRSFARRREFALDDLVAVSSSMVSFAKFELRDAPPVLVQVGYGWPAFIAASEHLLDSEG